MPKGTPSIKVRNVERLGAKVILYGRDFEEAKIECARLARAQQLIFVPPYDHPLVIAGQGTIGMEILRQVPQNRELDGIFVPVGGGGLVSGIAEYVKRISGHHTRVVGIETIDGDAMAQSIAHGSRVVLSEVGLFSDGTAVRVVGEEPFRICKESLDGVTKVNNDEICAAMKDIFEETRSVTEPAGALALAGLKRYIVDNNLIGANKCFVAVVSGANVDFGRLRYVAERAELGEGNEVLMMVDIPELPGKFVALYDMIHPRHVTEFVYRYAHSERAQVLISFRTQSLDRAADVMEVINDLAAKGMTGEDISDNELAKSHLRYLIGGSGKVENERLISFAFPEKPGSLREFLDCIRSDFNISLWHYRNHGGDVEKLLVGIQVPQGSEQKFQAFLSSLRYPYIDETDNMVFKRFMSQT
ncbi:hypothetical protein FRC02_010327 [Tulasnella sp. 418]|nr:hypothetical protein FRC02_010327 [Tulasnella sp. 418]